jgi:hypothetical protein
MYHWTLCNISEELDLYKHRRDDLKSTGVKFSESKAVRRTSYECQRIKDNTSLINSYNVYESAKGAQVSMKRCFLTPG